MNIIEKYIDRKLRRLAYLSSCKYSKEKYVIEKSYQKEQKSLVKRSTRKK